MFDHAYTYNEKRKLFITGVAVATWKCFVNPVDESYEVVMSLVTVSWN